MIDTLDECTKMDVGSDTATSSETLPSLEDASRNRREKEKRMERLKEEKKKKRKANKRTDNGESYGLCNNRYFKDAGRQ